MRKNIIILILAAVILGGAGGAGWALSRAPQAARETDPATVVSPSSVSVLEDSLALTHADLATALNELAEKTTALEASRQALTNTNAYLAKVESDLNTSLSQLSQAESELTNTREQLAAAIAENNESTPPRAFQSVPEAESWLDSHHLPYVMIAGQDGSISFNEPVADARYDCDDYARDYQAMALESGYIIDLCPVIYGAVWGIKVCDFPQAHIGCWAQIGDTYYYIECVPGYANSFKLTRITSAD
jgi:hypothetical protein